MFLDPKTKSEIFIKLYRNVENTVELRKKLMNQELKCCLIRCSLILDPFQIVVAANKALVAEKLTTKSIYTEVLYNLSITKNISKSLATFGVQDNDSSFLIIYFNQENEKGICMQIVGDEVPLSELNDLNDMVSIRKYYKIADIETKVVPTIDSIVSRIVTKDFLSH